MSQPRYDVAGIGNAIVDVLARTDDDVLARLDVPKGAMMLIDEPRAETIYEAMAQTVEMSGGSAANTIVGCGMLGLSGAFIGKVKQDQLGHSFGHGMNAAGVHFPTARATTGPATARSFILVTPDGERTMNTYLGAAQMLSPEDVDAETIAASGVTYLEGYLWDPPAAKEAFLKAATIAHDAKRHVALSLSDAFCVDRYRDEFLSLIREKVVDIVFANEGELKSLYQTADFATALDALRADARLAIVTRGEEGALAVEGTTMVQAPAFPVDKVVDTTGAGDLFAAGFLAGFARKLGHETSLRLGALCAAEVISHMGARPEANLKALAAENGIVL
ncbi:adenosine kinase [Phreatobacter aquaticus]|uniref:Adenosine kinase n=1 Tax=Phreatobacter aquaticus TaxID=2570229 RepID=A0A4D7QHY2_9HYPH|nr:adenosine kinase [Phreatobacter aquaticus]QCK85323.1 adenosine kinase [Phreatobacter aquaticus]